jgi:fatty acid desaturase
MAHHREEFGPEEPDIPLYAGYPISRESFRRKVIRDLTGQTGWTMLRGQLRALRSPDVRARRTMQKMIAVQLVLFTASIAIGAPLAYLLLWVLPWFTIWRLINRLRAIAEHGGLQADADRRNTTHSIKQHWLARFYMVPYNIGFHIAHHVDAGIPFRSLPEYHRAMRSTGFVTGAYEYPSYTAFWRAARTGKA